MTELMYTSTRDNRVSEVFQTAVLQGLSSEGGLFIPTKLPDLSIALKALDSTSTMAEIAAVLLPAFSSGSINSDQAQSMATKAWGEFGKNNAVKASLKLSSLKENESILELFHGPTLAFKDFGLALLAQIFSHYLSGKKAQVLVATSGDTGAAAVQAFAGVQGIELTVLFPKGGITPIQKQQIAGSKAGNVKAIEVDATFDDCQKMVKEALARKDEFSHPLLSVNSINFARVLAQSCYYIWTWLNTDRKPLSVCIPSGNFGNALAAYLAKQVGVDIQELLVAVNGNDFLHRFILAGDAEEKPTLSTLSNAMDIGIPSNLERLLAFEGLSAEQVHACYHLTDEQRTKHWADIWQHTMKSQSMIKSMSCSDSSTLSVMQRMHEKFEMVIDPHTAVSAYVSHRFPISQAAHRVIVSTAHPAKFSQALEKAGIPVPEVNTQAWSDELQVSTMSGHTSKLMEHLIQFDTAK